MISLRIDADTPQEISEQLLGFVALLQQGAAASTEVVEAPKATRKSKAAVEAPAEAKVETPVAEEPKRSVFDEEEAAPQPTFTKEQLQELAMAFGQKHGDDDLEALVKKHSTTGKFSGIPVTAYAALHAELTA